MKLLAGMCMQTATSNSSELVLQPSIMVHACLMCAGLHVWSQTACLRLAATQQQTLTRRPFGSTPVLYSLLACVGC